MNSAKRQLILQDLISVAKTLGLAVVAFVINWLIQNFGNFGFDPIVVTIVLGGLKIAQKWYETNIYKN